MAKDIKPLPTPEPIEGLAPLTTAQRIEERLAVIKTELAGHQREIDRLLAGREELRRLARAEGL